MPDSCQLKSINQMTGGRTKSLSEIPKEVQAHPCLEPRQDPCVPSHNEFICHLMGEKRNHYLKEVKRILDKMDSTDCPQKNEMQDQYGGGARGNYDKPMMKFPGYVDMESPKFRAPFYEPLITNVPIKEIRPTSEAWKHKGENSPILEYIPVEETECKPWALPRQRSFELRAGIMYRGCDCHKHNGLQDRCERSDCNGSQSCLTQPMPTCPPSQGFVCPPAQRPLDDMVREVVSLQHSTGSKTYCCCPEPEAAQYKTIGGKRFPDCNAAPGPGKLDCYKCRQ